MKVKVLNTQTQLEIREMVLDDSIDRKGECLLGRSPHSGLILDSPDVSRLHGKFAVDQGQYYFCDLGSSNGSLVNGKEAQPNQHYPLNVGDIIRVGEFLLMLYPLSEQSDLPATLIGDPNVTVIEQRPRVDDAIVQELATASEKIDEQSTPPVPEQASISIQPIDSFQESENQEAEEDGFLLNSAIDGQFDPLGQQQAVSEELPAESGTNSAPEATIDIAEVSLVPEDQSALQTDDSTRIQTEETSDALNSKVEITSSEQTDTEFQWEEPVDSTSESSYSQLILPQPDSLSGSLLVSETSDVAEEEPVLLEADLLQTDAAFKEDKAESEDLFHVVAVAVAISESALTPADPPEQPKLAPSQSIDDQSNAQLENDRTDTNFAASEATSEAIDSGHIIPASETNFAEFHEDEAEHPSEVDVNTAESPISPPQPADLLESDDADLPTELPPAVATPAIGSSSVAGHLEQATEVKNQHEAEEQSSAVVQTIQPVVVASDTTAAHENPNLKAAETSQKCLALLAHDSQIPALVKFVADHQKLLSHCSTITTPHISTLLKQQANFEASHQTSATSPGGYQTINSWIMAEKISAVVFLRDFITPQATQANDEAFSRACNIRQILFASNVPTAEALLHYLQNKVSVIGA